MRPEVPGRRGPSFAITDSQAAYRPGEEKPEGGGRASQRRNSLERGSHAT